MKIINKLLCGKERKSLAANFGYLSLLQIANYIFPFITMPYLAKTIGVDGFGKLAFAAAVIIWVQTTTDWGFNYTATRDVAKSKTDNGAVSSIFSNVLWARVLLMIASLVVLIILILVIPIFRENALVLLLSFLLVPGHIACHEWFFQAMEKMKYITIINVLSKLFFTIAVFVFIKEKNDYILQPILSAVGYLVAGVISFVIISKEWHIKFLKPNYSEVIKTIRKSFDVFVNNIIPNLYNSLGVIVLGFFCGSSSNGIFDAGNKFIIVGNQIENTISRTFFPLMARRIEKHNTYAKICLSISLLISVLFFLTAPILVKLFFTDEFSPAIVVLKIRSLSVFLVALIHVYGINYLLLVGKEKVMRKITTICSLIGFVIMIPFIYFWGYIGASVTILLTHSLLGISMFVSSKKYYKSQYGQRSS